MKDCSKTDISFCIPVYNVAPWLEKCIESIIAIKDNIKYEIICVDDCSTDDSLSILNSLSKRINNLTVLKNEQNGGVSFTRNKALSYAKGDYVWFVDPDDMINPIAAQYIINLAKENNADMIVGNYSFINETDELPISKEVLTDYRLFKNDGKPMACCAIDENGTCCTGVVPGMYKHSLLIEHNIKFNEVLAVAEDIMFNFDVLRYAKIIIKADSRVYFVRKRHGSSSSEFNEKRNKNIYKRMYDLYYVLQNYMDKKLYVRDTGTSSLEQLKLKQYYTQENVIRCLAMVRDKKFIKQELKKLKSEKIYPYQFRKESLGKSIKSLLIYLLPIELDFWFVHFLYGFKKKNYQHHIKSND